MTRYAKLQLKKLEMEVRIEQAKAPPHPPLPPALPGRKKNEENTSFVEKTNEEIFIGKMESQKKKIYTN